MPRAIDIEIAKLVLDQRWAAVATLEKGAPLASMVAYAAEPGLTGLLLFLSELAAHTRNMLEDGRISLAVTVPDSGEGDPQLLPRASLQGRITEIPRDSAGFVLAAERYVRRFPGSEARLQLADFRLFRFVVDEVRYVGGFARAVSIDGNQLREAAGTVA